MAGALRKAGTHIQDGLARIQEKSWAEPLGKGLGVGAKIVDCMGSFVPGAGILGGAMALGASLLNPEPSMEDLQKDLQDIKEQLSDDSLSRALVRALQKETRELEERIENPVGELKTSFDEVKTEMRKIFKSIEEDNLALSEDISQLKDVISQTFLLVADIKYKVRCNLILCKYSL